MNMIDVMKRLAELDATNPNVQTEAYGVGNRARQNTNNKTYNDYMSDVKYDDGQAKMRGVQRAGHRDAVGEEDPTAHVHINGKPWKQFPSRDEAKRVAANVQNKYPDKKVEVFGGEISMSEAEHSRTCPTCDGNGEDILHSNKPCPQCDGKGSIPMSKEQDVSEGKVKELADDLKNLSAEEFEKAHNMTKAEARKGLSESIADMRRLAGMTPLAECGMNPMDSMGVMNTMPAMPASISITAANGPELSGMLKDIMSLAGLNKVEAVHLNPAPPALMPPMHDAGAASPDGMSMRSVMDRLNPDMGDDMEDEGVMGGLAGAAAGAVLGGPMGAAAGYGVGSKMGDDLSDDDTEEDYDNTPADPRKKPAFDANQHANQANQPGQGDRMDGTMPRAHPYMKKTMEQIEQSLFDDYQSFINEDEFSAEKPATKFSAADKKKSDSLKKSSGKSNADALKKTSDAFAKKKA
jgi:hypothetical protein